MADVIVRSRRPRARGLAGARGIAVAVGVVMAVAVGCVPTSPGDPTVPTALDLRLTSTGFTVSWKPVAGASGYQVQYGDHDATPAVYSSAMRTTETSVEVSGLVPRRRYKFAVRAELDGRPRGWSTAVVAPFVVPVLPVIRIETAGEAPIVSKDVYLPGSFQLDVPGAPPVSSGMEIRGRGNSTWAVDKKPYRLKLGTSTAILGMPKSKHWVLLADRLDSTHLRTQVGFGLGEATSLAWTPRTRQVELVVNGAYEGVYEIVEHIRIDGDRVDVEEMSPTDVAGDAVTGGYVAQLDHGVLVDGDPGFVSRRGTPIVIEEPDPAALEQLTYLRDYVEAFEQALHSATFADPTTGYAAFLDVPSMVDYYLVSELVRNQDAFHGSTYFSKPRLGKLAMGPLWDLDNSLGNQRGWDSGAATGWFVRRDGVRWIDRLFDDPAFRAAVAARWDELLPVFEQMPARIVVEGAALADAMANEHVRWKYRPQPVETPQQLADWLQARIDWIDAHIHDG